MTATFERLLLDTDIVIFLLKKDQTRVERFLDLQEQSVIFLLSPLVVAEIYAGAFKREYPQIERFFGFCEHLQLDIETARLAGQYTNQYRKAYQGISLEDYLLAATAKRNKCPLWTGNRKHYPMTDITLFTE